MPFKSRSQISVCYNKKDPRWNCNLWMKETPSVCCLPYSKSTGKSKSRCMKVGERIVGRVQTGARGGRFFTIEEKDKKGKICTVKIYLSKKRGY
jgi:hypothetical protein